VYNKEKLNKLRYKIMKNYKGYYIDNVIFHSTEEIDEFLRNQAIEAYKKAVELFASHSTLENSIYADSKAEVLVNLYGFTWNDVEELEIATLQATA
jgi:hypothetical protein